MSDLKSSSAPVAAETNVIPFARRQSSGNGFGQKSLAGRRQRDPLQCYADFPDQWRAFLRAHFNSPDRVSEFFSVSVKAADKWWNGIGGAQGAKVTYALDEIEGADAWLLRRRKAA